MASTDTRDGNRKTRSQFGSGGIFAAQREFLREARIGHAMVGMLYAIPLAVSELLVQLVPDLAH